MSTWQETWAEVAQTIAKRSSCVRAQVGAVIVDKNQRIAATGYNGPAAGFPTSGACDSYCDRAKGGSVANYHGCPSIHAEANASLYVDRAKTEGATIYSTHFPCMDCAKLISNSGIVTVIAKITEADAHRNPHLVKEYLELCGIAVKDK
jgi:dCMP deaminase